MQSRELITLKQQLYAIADKLSVQKGRGYGARRDSLINLRFVEILELDSAEFGTWIRLADKVVRLGQILRRGEEYVGFEGLLDTVVDGINYFCYIPILISEKKPELRERMVQLGVDSQRWLSESRWDEIG